MFKNLCFSLIFYAARAGAGSGAGRKHQSQIRSRLNRLHNTGYQYV